MQYNKARFIKRVVACACVAAVGSFVHSCTRYTLRTAAAGDTIIVRTWDDVKNATIAVQGRIADLAAGWCDALSAADAPLTAEELEAMAHAVTLCDYYSTAALGLSPTSNPDYISSGFYYNADGDIHSGAMYYYHETTDATQAPYFTECGRAVAIGTIYNAVLANYGNAVGTGYEIRTVGLSAGNYLIYRYYDDGGIRYQLPNSNYNSNAGYSTDYSNSLIYNNDQRFTLNGLALVGVDESTFVPQATAPYSVAGRLTQTATGATTDYISTYMPDSGLPEPGGDPGDTYINIYQYINNIYPDIENPLPEPVPETTLNPAPTFPVDNILPTVPAPEYDLQEMPSGMVSGAAHWFVLFKQICDAMDIFPIVAAVRITDLRYGFCS